MIRRARIFHAPFFQWAVAALQQPALKIGRLFAIAIIGNSAQGQLLTGRTDAGDPAFVELKIILSEIGRFFLTFSFLLTFAVLLLLCFELAVTTAELVVGNVGIDAVLIKKLVVLLVGEAGVSGELGAFWGEDIVFDAQALEAFFYSSNHRLKSVVLLTVPKGLGIDNDLVFAVDSGHTVITLNRAFARCHFGGFVIGDIAFDFFPGFALADFWLLSCEKFVDAIGSFIKCVCFLLKSSGPLLTIATALVRLLMLLDAVFDLPSQFIALFFQLLKRT